MGRQMGAIVIKVHTHVSRHNDPRDERDDALVEELEQRLTAAVEEITRDPRYAPVLD